MKCPLCGYADDKVLDTRIQKDGEQIRRRRECLDCKNRYSTVETIMPILPLVIKKDGRREAYAKEKVLKGLQAACQKRPVSLSQMESVVETVTQWVLDRFEQEIESSRIGLKVMNEVKSLDDVAYVRFASVYKTFKDVDEFVDSLKDLPPLSKENLQAN